MNCSATFVENLSASKKLLQRLEILSAIWAMTLLLTALESRPQFFPFFFCPALGVRGSRFPAAVTAGCACSKGKPRSSAASGVKVLVCQASAKLQMFCCNAGWRWTKKTCATLRNWLVLAFAFSLLHTTLSRLLPRAFTVSVTHFPMILVLAADCKLSVGRGWGQDSALLAGELECWHQAQSVSHSV